MPRPSCAFLAVMVRELTPIQEISDDRRPYSILGQRSITTLRPAASALAAASGLRTPSCIQITCGRGCSASASSTIGTAYCEPRNIGQPCVDHAAQDLLAGMARIDRDHVVAALFEIFERKVARPIVLRRKA